MKNLHDRGVISRYREYLPVTKATPEVSLNEGSTPLIYSPKLSTLVGRGTEAPEVVERRLAKAEDEYRERVHYDHVVVNDVLERCVAEVRDLIGLGEEGS